MGHLFSHEGASWTSRFLPRLLQPRRAAPPGRVGLLPRVAPALGPGSRLLPGAVQPWAWWAASAEAGGCLSAADLCQDLGRSGELPGHWQAVSLPLRVCPPGVCAPPLDERATVRFRTRANILVIYKLKHTGRGVGWGGGSSCGFTEERHGGGTAEDTQVEEAAGEGTVGRRARLAGHPLWPPASGLGHQAQRFCLI